MIKVMTKQNVLQSLALNFCINNMTRFSRRWGVLQSSGLAIAISSKSSEPLEIPDPPVSDSETSVFSRTYNFSQFDRKPGACYAKSIPVAKW
jgi:hypothetical protein